MPTQPKCPTCRGTGKSGKAKLYNPDGTVRRIYARTCTTCSGSGRISVIRTFNPATGAGAAKRRTS